MLKTRPKGRKNTAGSSRSVSSGRHEILEVGLVIVFLERFEAFAQFVYCLLPNFDRIEQL